MHASSMLSSCTVCVIASILVAPVSAAEVMSTTWRLQRDDITEYILVTSFVAKDTVECLFHLAATNAGAASFDAASGDCTGFACNRGASGCRKCRNANNLSQPLLWMKQESVSCWKTFQHRVDASVSFNRSWTEYVNGFGQGERLNYWMGLEQIHQITRDGVRRVRWEFSDWNDTWYWAENENFSVADAADSYRARMGPLDSSKSNVGQLTDEIWSPNNQKFSTFDSDSDQCSGYNCALGSSSGWWFSCCTMICPNGEYLMPPAALNSSGIFYLYYRSGRGLLTVEYSMKTFECMIQQ